MSNKETRIGFLPPTTTTDAHRRPPSSTTTPTHYSTRLRHPLNFQNPSPPPKPTSYVSPSSANSPENPGTETTASKIAAILGRAISMMPSTSFEEALAATATTTNAGNSSIPLRRTLSDPTSIAYQEALTTTTPPPRAPEPARTNTIRRTVSDISSFAGHEGPRTTPTPPRVPRRPLLPAARTLSPSPNARKVGAESSNRRETPQSKRLKRMEDMMREIEKRCWEVIHESEEDEQEEEEEYVQDASQHNNDENSSQAIMAQEEPEATVEEGVVLEWLNDGLRIQLSCPCAQGFEILLKQNGCFYRRLT